MPHSRSVDAEDEWFTLAQEDLTRARTLIGVNDASGAAFHLQQGIEKGLKAFLTRHGWRLRRTHDLSVLLHEALGWDESLVEFRGLCDWTRRFYTVTRYPVRIVPDVDKVKSLLESADHLLGRLGE